MQFRRYTNEDDYWRIRAFLRRFFLKNDRHEFSWPVARLDYCRWHGIYNMAFPPFEDHMFIWENEAGQIIAALNEEDPGQIYLHIDPDFNSPALNTEMIAVAEEHLYPRYQKKGERFIIWAHEHDQQRQEILTERGYIRQETKGYEWQRDLNNPLPPVQVPAGYQVRSLGTDEELPLRSWVSWRAFHPDDPDENYEGWEWYRNIIRAPLYRRDLDIVAVAPTGEFAAFCTVWFDDVTRSGLFEPVGTDPEHQQKGLGKAVMAEGMRRLKERGGNQARVAGFSAAANALYGRMMDSDPDVCAPWLKK